MNPVRVAFVHNFCTHYTRRTFEELASRHRVHFYFLSRGDEWYWLPEHSVERGVFSHAYLTGIRVGRLRVTPALLPALWRGEYDVYVKSLGDRLALPLVFLVARLRGRPFVLWTGIWQWMGGWFHRTVAPIVKYIYRHADAVVAYGEHVKRFLIESGVNEERIFVAPHAVDNDQHARPVGADELAQLRSALSLPVNAKVILYVGRLEVNKGLPFLIRAFAEVRRDDVVLVIVGTGSRRRDLARLVEDLGVNDRTRFAGYVAPAQTPRYYALAWTLVVPSITLPWFKEPWGLVVNEAFNQGVPVVATESVGAVAGGLVRHGETGIVVPERDPEAIRVALVRMLDEPGLRDRMGEAAQSLITAWTQEAMVDAFDRAITYVATRA